MFSSDTILLFWYVVFLSENQISPAPGKLEKSIEYALSNTRSSYWLRNLFSGHQYMLELIGVCSGGHCINIRIPTCHSTSNDIETNVICIVTNCILLSIEQVDCHACGESTLWGNFAPNVSYYRHYSNRTVENKII